MTVAIEVPELIVAGIDEAAGGIQHERLGGVEADLPHSATIIGFAEVAHLSPRFNRLCAHIEQPPGRPIAEREETGGQVQLARERMVIQRIDLACAAFAVLWRVILSGGKEHHGCHEAGWQ
jgi:hypothetical protein